MGLLWVVLQLICLVPLYRAVPINRQVGLSENIYITSRNDTYGNEQKVCVIDDVLYHDGDSIPTTSPCEHCICRPPGFACTIINCEIKAGCKAIKRSNQCCPEYKCECERSGQIYQNGEKITDPDTPCEVCYCQGGEVICAVIECYWRDDCEPRYVPGRCCPNYDHCPPLKPLHPGRPTPRPTTSSTSTAVSITTRPTYPTEYFTSPTTSQQSSTSQGFPQQDHLTSIAPAQDISEEPVPLQESIASKSPLPETTTAVLQDITAQQLPEGVATDGLPPEITFTLKPDAETSEHHPEEPNTAEIDKEGSQTTQASDVNVPSQEPETLIIQIIEDDKDVEPAATTATTTTTTTQDVSGATLPSESSEVEELTQTEDDANSTMVVSDEKSSSEHPIITTIAFSSASEDLHTVSQLAESSTGSSDTMPLSDLEQNLHQPLHDTQTTLIAGTQYEETSQHELASTEIPTVFIDELQTPEDKSTPRPQSDIIEATVIESGTPEQQQDVQQQDVQILEIQNDENTQDPTGSTEGQGDLQEHANVEPNPKPIYEDQNIYDTDVNPYIPQDIAQDSGEDSVQSEHEQPQGELENDNIELKTHILQETVKDESQIDDLPEVEQDIQSQNLHSSDTDNIAQSQNEDYEEKDQHGVRENIGNSQQLENTNTELKTNNKETTESKDELNLDIDQEIQQKPDTANLLKDTSDTDLPGTHVNPVEYTSEIKENDGLQGYQPIENIANIKDLIETIVQAREPVVVSEFDMDEPVEQMDQEHTESSATTLNDVVILSLIKHTPQNEIQNASETDLESTPEATGESITESSQINEEQQQYQDPEEDYSSNIQTENQEAQTAPPTNGEIQSTTATEGIPISNDNSLNEQTSKEENSATQQYPVSPTDSTYETDTETEETLMLRHSGLLENNNSDANDDYLETDEDAETGTEKNINDLPEKNSTTQENLHTTTESVDLYTEGKIKENYNYTDDSSTHLFNEDMSVGGDDIYNSNTSDPYLSTEYHNSTTTYPSLVNSRESNTEAVTEGDNTEVIKTESESEDMITVSTTNPTMDFAKESFTILPKTHHEESEVGEYQDNQTESPTTEAEPVQITSSEGDDLTHGSDAEENNTQETTPNVQQQYALRTANPSQFNTDSEGIMHSIDSTTNSNLNETAEIMDASQITTENFANSQTSTDQHEQTTSSVNSEDNDDIQVFFVEVITDGRKVTEISSSEQPTEVTVAPELKEDILSGTNQSSNETADDNLTHYTTTEEAANEELGIEQYDILTDKEDALQQQNIPFLGKIGSLSSEHQETVDQVDLAETDSDAESEEVKRYAANVVTENTTTNETDTIRIVTENETQQPDNYLSLDSFVTTTYDNLDAYATEESAVTSERLLTTQLTEDYSDENAEAAIGEHNNQEKEIAEFTTISTTPSEVNHDNDHTIQTKIYKPENLEILEKHEMQTMSNLQEDIEENLSGTEAITETNTSNDQTLTPIGYTERSEDMPQQTTEFLEDALKSQESEDDTDLKQHDSTVSEKELNDSEDTVNEKGDSDNTSINLKSGIPLNEETDTSIDSEGESEYDSNRNEGEVQTTSEEMQGVTDSSISEHVTFQVTSEETGTKSETESITVGDENTERTLDENLSDFRVAPNQIPVNTVQSEEQKPHLPDSGLQASSSIVELPPDSTDNNETDLEDKSTGNVKSTGLEQTVINDEYEVHTDATPTSTEYYTKDSSQSETEGANSFELRMKDMSEVLKQASEETYEDDSSGDGREEASAGAGEIENYETTTSMEMSTNQEVEDTNREESTENFNTETITELIREETEQPQVPEFYAGKNYDPTTDAASTHQEEDELTSTEEPPVTVYAIEIIPIKTKINQNNEVSGNQDSHVEEQTLKSETSLEFNDSTSPLYDADDHVTDTDDRELSTEGIYEDSRETTESQTVAEFKLQEQTTSKSDAMSETSEKIYSSEGSVTEFQTTSTESSTQSTTQSSEIHSSVDVTSDDEVKGTKEVLLDDEFLREQQIHRNPDAIPGVEPDFQRSSKLQIRSRRSASSESWIDRVVRYINEAIFGA